MNKGSSPLKIKTKTSQVQSLLFHGNGLFLLSRTPQPAQVNVGRPHTSLQVSCFTHPALPRCEGIPEQLPDKDVQ